MASGSEAGSRAGRSRSRSRAPSRVAGWESDVSEFEGSDNDLDNEIRSKRVEILDLQHRATVSSWRLQQLERIRSRRAAMKQYADIPLEVRDSVLQEAASSGREVSRVAAETPSTGVES